MEVAVPGAWYRILLTGGQEQDKMRKKDERMGGGRL